MGENMILFLLGFWLGLVIGACFRWEHIIEVWRRRAPEQKTGTCTENVSIKFKL